MKRKLALSLIALLTAFAIYNALAYPTHYYRFRMTVEVETPEGLKTGSSVYEVGAKNRMKLTSEEGKRDVWSKGEALSVDLPNGSTLFALLKTGALHSDMASLSMETLDPAFKNDIVESAARIERRQGVVSPAAVAPKKYPMLVTFRDISNPKSVERIDPTHLDATFGRGYRLKQVIIATTDDDVTIGIAKRIRWLDRQIGTLVRRPDHVSIGDMPIEHRLTELDFRKQ